MSHVRSTTELAPGETAAVLALAEAAKKRDEVAPLSEQTLLRVRHGAKEACRFYLLNEPSGLAGFAFTEENSGELVVSPDHRRRGFGDRLLAAVLADTPQIGIWAHGQHPGARALALRHGLVRVRGLRKMRIKLQGNGGSVQLAEPQLRGRAAERLRIRTFVPGRDEQAVLDTNRNAFFDHPEQGALTLEDLRQRENEEWFDPDGFFVAEDRETGRIAGFHWTKTHTDGAGLTSEGPVGEVYVVGVDPGWQGTGLGRALTLHGVRYLRDRGLPWVLLYVEEDNPAAVHLYESIGFTVWNTDVLYAAPGLL